MLHKKNLLIVSATAIVLSNAVQCMKRHQKLWIRLFLLAREKYSTTDFMKDLILDNVNALGLEYQFKAGFINFFSMSTIYI